MTGSPSLDLDQSIQAVIIEHLTDRAPTINARRAAKLCQSQGLQVDDDLVQGALERLAGESKVELVRKGVYRLLKAQEAQDTALRSASPAQVSPALASPLTQHELDLMRRYQGKRAPAQAALSRADLEDAQRVASYLTPYPAAPVDLEDVARVEEALGRARAQEALWLHLAQEVAVVCDLYQTPRVSSRDEVRETARPQGVVSHVTTPEVSVDRGAVERAPETSRQTLSDPSAQLSGRSKQAQAPQGELATQPIFSALKEAQHPLSIAQLSARLSMGEARPKRALYELRKLLISVNRDAELRGARPPFSFEITGEVSLSEWGVSSTMRASEGRLTRERALYQEQLYIALAERLRQLSSAGFAQLLSRLLEELGCERVETLNAPQGDGVALIAHHPEWGDCLTLAQRSKKALTLGKVKEVARSLSALQADRALLISLSGFSEDTLSAPPEVRLIRERDLLDLMITHQVGVSHYSLPMSYVDAGFFERLSEGAEGQPERSGGD